MKPRKDILATISARKRIATVTSQINVKYFKNGYRSKVFGVLRQTEKSATKAQSLSKRRTQSYKELRLVRLEIREIYCDSPCWPIQHPRFHSTYLHRNPSKRFLLSTVFVPTCFTLQLELINTIWNLAHLCFSTKNRCEKSFPSLFIHVGFFHRKENFLLKKKENSGLKSFQRFLGQVN